MYKTLDAFSIKFYSLTQKKHEQCGLFGEAQQTKKMHFGGEFGEPECLNSCPSNSIYYCEIYNWILSENELQLMSPTEVWILTNQHRRKAIPQYQTNKENNVIPDSSGGFSWAMSHIIDLIIMGLLYSGEML